MSDSINVMFCPFKLWCYIRSSHDQIFFGMMADLMCLCCLILINFPGRTNKENFFLVYQNPHFLTGFHCHEPLVNLVTCASNIYCSNCINPSPISPSSFLSFSVPLHATYVSPCLVQQDKTIHPYCTLKNNI